MNASIFRVRAAASGIAAGLLAVGLVAAGLAPAQAQLAHPAVVSEDPANFTPNLVADAVVPNPAVNALAQLGNTMYAGGQFRAIQNAPRTVTYPRSNIVGFDATSGAVTPFAPDLNGTVWTIVASGEHLYVGGQFTTVGGIARRALARIHATTGALDPSFAPSIPYGTVFEMRMVGGRLIVGGSFAKRLVALHPATGADTGYINLPITGSVASNAGPTDVYRFAVNPFGDRLVALGNFTTVAGQTRYRAFMLDLGPTTATLSSWYYSQLTKMCAASSLPSYLRDVDFSPRGDYFAFVSTGFVPRTGDIGLTLCDATARFETAHAGGSSKPAWINYTGGDTLHSVAVTGAAVYINGHQRWVDNPLGRDSCLTTCVSRPGIAAIDPTTGRALPWNPGKTRGVGGKDLLATSTGLWVASDGRLFRGEYRYGIAFVPLVP